MAWHGIRLRGVPNLPYLPYLRDQANKQRNSSPQRHTGLCQCTWPNDRSLPLGFLLPSVLCSLQERRSRTWHSFFTSLYLQYFRVSTHQADTPHQTDTTHTRQTPNTPHTRWTVQPDTRQAPDRHQTPDPRPPDPRSKDPEKLPPYLTLGPSLGSSLPSQSVSDIQIYFGSCQESYLIRTVIMEWWH